MTRAFTYDLFPNGQLPVGRLVGGDCYTPKQKTDNANRPMVHPPGHSHAGEPVMQYFQLVAYPKTDPAFPVFRQILLDEAKVAWPQYFDAAGNCTNPKFAHKVIDGDGADENGKLWSTREGYAGCWVVRYGTTFPPTVMDWAPELGAWRETAPGKIKPGDYVKVSGTTNTNGSAQSPGMHVNPALIAFEREGERIVIGMTAEQGLGAGPGGAAPTAGTTTPPPPAPAVPEAPPPPSYPITKLAAGPIMLPAAKGVTYAKFLAAGWTDVQLIAQGMMQAPTAG